MECPRRAIDRKSKWRIGIYLFVRFKREGCKGRGSNVLETVFKGIYTYVEKQENEIITARTTMKKNKKTLFF